MATLIDDGLVEDCLDDTITITNLEEVPIIDLDDIDAAIEDSGYIFDDQNVRKQTQEYTSSYKKESVPLPAQFFDIDSNVNFLKRCRPISIKIVDCNIHPWYYKRKKCQASKDTDSVKVEDKDKDMLKDALADFITFNCNDKKYENYFVNESNFDEIKLSSKQSLAISKLKDDIENKIRTYKISKHHDLNLNTNENSANRYDIKDRLPKSDKSIDKWLLNKNNDVVDSNELLAYKAIAQTIVRNIDYGGVKKPEENVINVDSCEEDVGLVDVGKLNDLDGKQSNERIITSPILPCTVRPKNKRKEKLPKTSINLEICNNPHKSCHKFVSADKVIPHYHYIYPNSISTNYMNHNRLSAYTFNNNNHYVDNNSLSHYNITRDTCSHYVTQPNSNVNKKYPPNTDPHKFNPLMRSETYANQFGFTSGPAYDPTTRYSPLLQNAPICRTPYVVKKSNTLNNQLNPNAYVPYPTTQLNYLGTFPQQDNLCHEYSYPTITETTTNVSNVSDGNSCKENYRLFYKNSAPPFIPNSLYPKNEYVSAKRFQNPVQMTVAYVQKKNNHPLLTKLLDSDQTSIITGTENNLNINTDTNKLSTGPPVSEVDTTSKIDLDALITVLAQTNCDSSNLRTNNTNSIRKNTKPKKEQKGIPVFATLNECENDIKLDNNSFIKTLQPAQHDFEIIMPSEQIPRKLSRYSPPILPIPTFKKGLEILSQIQPCIPPNEDGYIISKAYCKPHTYNSRRECNNTTKMKRKRTVNSEEKILVSKKSRKISLQEYKQRQLQNSKEDTNICGKDAIKTHNKRTEMCKTSPLGCRS